MKRICKVVKSLIIIILLSPFCSKGAITLVPPFVDSFYCAGDTFSVGYNVSGLYAGANVFSVVLSNASGSFGSGAAVIGFVNDSVSGTILCTVPSFITSGTNYRIKVRSNLPLDSSTQNGYPITFVRVPIPTASANPATICIGDSLRLSATDSIPVTFSWTGPAGFNSSANNPVRLNAQLTYAGNYFVTASVASCSTSSFVNVKVNPLPAKPIASHFPVTPCTGDTLKLSSSTSTVGVSYGWTGPGFGSSSQNPIIGNIDTLAKGNYIVTVSLNGCIAKDTTTVINIKISPNKPIISCDSPACNGAVFHLFSNTTTTGVTYNWSGPPAFSDTVKNPIINSLSTANNGAFVVTVSKAGCSSSNSIFVNVSPRPILTALTITGACEGDTLKLHTSSTSTGTYSWTITTGYANTTNTGDIARPNSSTAYNGTYFVMLKDAVGCFSDTGFTVVTIKPKPAVPTIQTNSPVCENHNLFLSGSSTTGGVSYGWTGPGGISFSNNQLFLPNAKITMGGNYIFTATLNGCSSSANANVVVNPAITPDVTITADPGTIVNPGARVLFTANALKAGNNPKYQWRKNGVDITGATSDVYFATIGKDLSDHDNLSVRIVSSEACPFPDTVVSYVFTVLVNDLSDLDVDNDVIVYPGPNHGKFTIKGTVNTNDAVDVRIIDAIGQLVYEDLILPSNKHLILPVDITGVASGVYMLQLKAGDQLINRRFTIR